MEARTTIEIDRPPPPPPAAAATTTTNSHNIQQQQTFSHFTAWKIRRWIVVLRLPHVRRNPSTSVVKFNKVKLAKKQTTYWDWTPTSSSAIVKMLT